jgi:acid phosphatase
VLVVIEENEDRGTALRSMPDLAALAQKYGQATDYSAITHPSLPNYLAIAGGSTFGIRDDELPASHHLTGPTVFDQALAVHRTAKAYAESMPTPCDRTPTSVYAPRHNPWVYFTDPSSRRNCARDDVPFGTFTSGAFHRDVLDGTLPDVGMVTPNMCDDAHDCGLATADHWLRRLMDLVERGPDFRTGRLAVVVTFDEGSNTGPNTVACVIVDSRLSHRTITSAFGHYSLSSLLSQVSGTTPLRRAATAPAMLSAIRG